MNRATTFIEVTTISVRQSVEDRDGLFVQPVAVPFRGIILAGIIAHLRTYHGHHPAAQLAGTTRDNIAVHDTAPVQTQPVLEP